MPPHPKFKKTTPVRSLRKKILNGQASGIQALKYVRNANHSNDLAFERACSQLKKALWGEDWRECSHNHKTKEGLWHCLFMETYIKKTGDNIDAALFFSKEKFKEALTHNPDTEISPVKAALIQVGEYKRTFKRVQEQMKKGDFETAGHIEKEYYHTKKEKA